MWRALLDKKPVAFALDLKETYDRVGVARAAINVNSYPGRRPLCRIT